jgi:hypothetical protein
MDSWHTVAEPANAAEYDMNGTNAIIRFTGTGLNGWMVAGEGVWSSHDSGRTWLAVGALQGQHVDALEAWGSYTYAVGRGSDSLWVSTDPAADTSWTEHTFVGLPSDTEAVDNLQADNTMVAITRTHGTSATVRLSKDHGNDWLTVPNACKGHGTGAPVYALVQENIHRFVCGDGTVIGLKDGAKPVVDTTFQLSSTSGTPVHANAVATNNVGTMVAYTGAGLWGFVQGGTSSHPITADVGWVGLTGEQGLALPAVPGPNYWKTINGGITWFPKSWN